MKLSQPSPAYLAECFSYDRGTGVIRWSDRPRGHFGNEAAYKTHQRTKAGNVAGCLDESTGYLVIGLSRQILYAHRVAWALMHGAWPPQNIDHIDGNKTNNREINLRCVPQADNARNASMSRNNLSGVSGVSFAKREGKWRARVMHNYRDIHCGYFATKEEAIDARQRAIETLGFHSNHGRSA